MPYLNTVFQYCISITQLYYMFFISSKFSSILCILCKRYPHLYGSKLEMTHAHYCLTHPYLQAASRGALYKYLLAHPQEAASL